MNKKFLFFAFTMVLISACSLYNIDSEEVADNFYPSKESALGIEYADYVSRPYEVVGFVTVNSERNQKMDDIIAKMKREAAVLGGDAITNITSNATGSWKKVPPQKMLGNAYIRANYTATVIVYQDQAQPAAE